MPNWVQNDISIKTNNPILADLMQKVANDNKVEFFNTICPIGEWDYDRAIEKWGCKWEIKHVYAQVSIEKNDDYVLNVSGDTAWVFPENFLNYVLDTFTTDEYFVNVACVWLEDQGYWGHFIDGSQVAEGFLTIKDIRAKTEASKLLYEHFGVDEDWLTCDNGEGLGSDEDE